MHVCECMFLLLYKAHGDCDCWEAMHACVGVYVWACLRRIVTLLAARQFTHVSECVFGLCTRCMLTLIAARRCIRVSECVFVLCARRCFDVCMFVHE